MQQEASSPALGDRGADRTAIEAGLRARYRSVESAIFDVGPSGPTGLFFIAGDLQPSEERRRGSGNRLPAQKPESTASAFVRDEAEFLGMTRPDEELRLRRKTEDNYGRVHVFFDKYIAGVRLDGMDVRVHMNPDGSVFAFQGNLIALSASTKADIAAAASSARITEERVREIITGDIGAGVGFVMRAEKLAIPSRPYVVWRAGVSARGAAGNLVYTIDAITGQAISKERHLVDIRQGER
jgi:Zn-dependent metalloprotease